MTGSEKQIKWATDLKNSVNNAIDFVLANLGTIPGFNPAAGAKVTASLTDRKAKLNACQNSAEIIEFFQGFEYDQSNAEATLKELSGYYNNKVRESYNFK